MEEEKKKKEKEKEQKTKERKNVIYYIERNKYKLISTYLLL